MTRRFLAAVAFLSRFPVPEKYAFGAADVGKASLFFPVVGAVLGAVLVFAHHLFWPALPAALVAVLLLTVGALATGALHLDGLADSADGFGGGRTPEDVLRIMRDHAIGTFGAVALLLVVGIKVTALASLIEASQADILLLLAPTLARWSPAALGYFLPYARRDAGLGASAGNIGSFELWGATLLALALAVFLGGWAGVYLFFAVASMTLVMGIYCMRRIGGITGDTLGANAEICEALVYVVGLVLVR